ncbi:MAG: phytanoyl-CoA dioxygenase family protein [Cyanobium sp. LacPavin_0818_WC50_MAG_67_9]|nr:phytanoyl-CoA dioxygenase family protein [Cyanobium sp. LacPavin_0818_WC50_MAG_67_9]
MQLAEARFHRDGFCHLPELLTPQDMAQLLAQQGKMQTCMQRKQGASETLSFMHRQITALAEIFTAPSLLARLAHHVGQTASQLQLLGTTLYCKAPGWGGTAWHQDGRFIPSDSLQAFTLWVPLQPISRENAPLVFFPGSQHQCLIEQPLPSNLWPEPIGTAGPVVAAPLVLGDATLHQLWTLHGSLGNATSEERQALIVNYLTAPLVLNPLAAVGGGQTAALINRVRQWNLETLECNAD